MTGIDTEGSTWFRKQGIFHLHDLRDAFTQPEFLRVVLESSGMPLGYAIRIRQEVMRMAANDGHRGPGEQPGYKIPPRGNRWSESLEVHVHVPGAHPLEAEEEKSQEGDIPRP